MTRLRAHCFSISLDGFGAGPDHCLDNPMGVGGLALHDWAIATRTLQAMFGNAGGGTTGTDDDFVVRGFDGIGAWIIGRNMFGPVRGPWPDEDWRGWWGDEPPYHCDVFVLTHHARPTLEMAGGTRFHFVTDGIDAALDRAIAAAAGKDVRIGGGVATLRQCLAAGRLDELHLAVAPVLLGRGEPLFAGLDLPALGLACSEHVATPGAAHYVLTRQG